MLRIFLSASFLLGASLACLSVPPATPGPATNALTPMVVKSMQIADDFWAPKLRTYRERTIPHSWNYMGWNLRALHAAAGDKVEGDLNGTWDEANLHKFLETIARSLDVFPDPALEKRADQVIALLGRAQRPDGYLHAHVTNAKKAPWDPGFLDGSHDGYVLGHLIEAAIEYQASTGKRTFLDIAIRAADQAHRHFLGTNGQPGFCGHAELEMALVELYRVTGERRYLELATAFIEWRGRGQVKPAGPTPRAYFQDAVPLREQRTLEGHAVRAIFFASGVADVALESGDVDYRLAATRFWDSTARRRMAITGSTGPRQEHEAFGEDHELPDDGYYESCAACGLADFAQRMFLLERRAEYADVLERVLYNAVLHGISLDGTNSYYQNPLTDRDRPRYNSWVCCPPNLSRTLFKVGRYASAVGEREIFINLFVGGTISPPWPDASVKIAVATEYPWDGAVKFTVEAARPQQFALNLRWPGWCEKLALRLNGQAVSPLPRTDAGYLRLDRIWSNGDTVELALDMPVQRIEAHPNIRTAAGKLALQRGPIVYGFEGLDNGGNARIELGAEPQFTVEHRRDLLGGVMVIRGATADGRPFLAVPFYTLANRAKSSQEVWAAQRGLKASHKWWEGRLYREVSPDRLRP